MVPLRRALRLPLTTPSHAYGLTVKSVMIFSVYIPPTWTDKHFSPRPTLGRVVRFYENEASCQERRVISTRRQIANGGSLLLLDTMKLVDSTIRSFRVAKVFRENSDRINHINFSPNGETLITSSDDDSIVIYDCLEGKWARSLENFNSTPREKNDFTSWLSWQIS